jgi:hypothetical protein
MIRKTYKVKNMKAIKLYIPLLLLALASCKKYIDVNDNPNSPTTVQEALLLAPLELAISHSIDAGASVNATNYGFSPILMQHYTQVICLNQPVPNEGTYLLVNSQVDGDWGNVYVTCLNNLTILNNKAETDSNYHYAGIAKILSAFCLGVATDWWGDVPYTEALKGSDNFTPKYDAQEEIYKTIQSLLDNGIGDIAKNKGKQPAADDYFYAGDMDKWTKLAYTLKARFYMHLTKAPGYTAAQQATLAMSALDKAMQSNEDNLKFSYPGTAGQENQWYWNFSPTSTLVMSSAFVDTLKSRNDPRLTVLVSPAPATGLYTGRAIGTPGVGSLEDYSIPGNLYAAAGANNYIINYSEVLFLKAEATLIASGATAAAPVYKQAIEADMVKSGLDVTSTSVTTYVNGRTAINAQNALRRIIEDKVIANFLSIENFNDWRRTGYPVLQKVPNALSDIPRRIIYPQLEKTSNPQPQQTAKLTDRVWWDVQ